jgi:hypothetical protein
MNKSTNIYKKAVFLIIMLFVLFISFIPVTSLFNNYNFDKISIIIYIILYLSLALYSLPLKCPKCKQSIFKGKYFNGIYFYGPIPQKACLNCNLNLNKYYSKEDINKL